MASDVEIENLESWPSDFRQLVQKNRGLVLAYQLERGRIDQLAQNDIFVRINPPPNPHKEAYQELVEHLEPILTRNRLVAYHCTRLTPNEILHIRRDGLEMLSNVLVRRRLDQCHADGLLEPAVYERLLNSAIIRDTLDNQHGNRTAMSWFCPNRSTLQQSSGVYRLFRSWGGEAVYLGHEDNGGISQAIRHIGTPCIVKCAIPFSDAKHSALSFTERFLSQEISKEIDYPEPSPTFDLHVKRNLSADEVLKIIPCSDPCFEDLTACSTWEPHEQIFHE